MRACRTFDIGNVGPLFLYGDRSSEECDPCGQRGFSKLFRLRMYHLQPAKSHSSHESSRPGIHYCSFPLHVPAHHKDPDIDLPGHRENNFVLQLSGNVQTFACNDQDYCIIQESSLHMLAR